MSNTPPYSADMRFTVVPGGSTVTFPAYIATLTDRYSPAWSQFFEIGRADHKVLYSKFIREIDLQFRIIAEDSGESAQDIFDKMDDLAQATYPRDVADGFQGNFLRFSIGGIYNEEIGYVANLQYNWDNSETNWDNGYPFYTTTNMTIVWIGKERPKQGVNAYGKSGAAGWPQILTGTITSF